MSTRLPGAIALTIDRVVTPVEGMHRTISSRWFRAVGPIARPVQLAHDGVAGLVYAAIRSGSRTIARTIEATQPSSSGLIDETARAWVNGLWGDALGSHEAGLSMEMTAMDVSRSPIPPSDEPLQATSASTPQLVFLVHGLFETERRWTAGDASLAWALADAGFSPVLVRYNTGLAVESNGAHLADLIADVVEAWPVPVETIALVGHSMGGIVARHAYAAASTGEHAWIEQTTDLVTIGTPHEGAPLEKLARAVTRGLGFVSVTQPLATFLGRRSRGIRDLGSTSIAEPGSEAWARIRRRAIGGVLTHDPNHPVGVVVGDLMVRTSSSITSRGFSPHHTMLVGGVNHQRLLDHPSIAEQVVAWLEEPLDLAERM